MHAIDVLAGGMLTTIQDLGRTEGVGPGVPPSGALDSWALSAANRLVGNPDGAAGLEMTFVGPVLRFDGTGAAALAGADLGALLNGHPVAPWRSFAVTAGSVLTFAGARDGLRGYLAVAGGIEVPLVAGSRSTCVGQRTGGLEGRPLRGGDWLPVGPGGSIGVPVRCVPRRSIPTYGHAPTLRVVIDQPGCAFTDDGLGTFLGETYTLALQSDRAACRLIGPAVETLGPAAPGARFAGPGSVLVSREGLPIVLMADGALEGHGPLGAAVVAADLPRLAQAVPGDRVRFSRIGPSEAEALLESARAALEGIGAAPTGADDLGALYEEDSGAALAADAYVGLADAVDGAHTVPECARRNAVCAAMPGLVLSVSARTCDVVEAGQPLLVLEAMKMQSPVRAPRRGRVGRVHVSPGMQVEGGAPLLDIDDE